MLGNLAMNIHRIKQGARVGPTIDSNMKDRLLQTKIEFTVVTTPFVSATSFQEKMTCNIIDLPEDIQEACDALLGEDIEFIIERTAGDAKPVKRKLEHEIQFVHARCGYRAIVINGVGLMMFNDGPTMMSIGDLIESKGGLREIVAKFFWRQSAGYIPKVGLL